MRALLVLVTLIFSTAAFANHTYSLVYPVRGIDYKTRMSSELKQKKVLVIDYRHRILVDQSTTLADGIPGLGHKKGSKMLVLKNSYFLPIEIISRDRKNYWSVLGMELRLTEITSIETAVAGEDYATDDLRLDTNASVMVLKDGSRHWLGGQDRGL